MFARFLRCAPTVFARFFHGTVETVPYDKILLTPDITGDILPLTGEPKGRDITARLRGRRVPSTHRIYTYG